MEVVGTWVGSLAFTCKDGFSMSHRTMLYANLRGRGTLILQVTGKECHYDRPWWGPDLQRWSSLHRVGSGL